MPKAILNVMSGKLPSLRGGKYRRFTSAKWRQLDKAAKKHLQKVKKRARKARRVRRAVPEALEPITITKGDCMSGKRRRRRRAKFTGFEGRRKRRRSRRSYGFEGRRRRKRYYGGGGGGRVSPVGAIINGAVAIGGGVASSMAAHYIPIANPKIKAVIPIAIGLALGVMPMTRRNKVMQSVALGSIIVGGLSLVRQMLPTVPLLTGDIYEGETMYVPQYGEAPAMLGYPATFGDNLDGEVIEQMGDLDGVGEQAE